MKRPQCDHRDAHDPVTDTPIGNRCGEPATHRIEWTDRRYSFGCDAHLTIEEGATVKPSRVVKLKFCQGCDVLLNDGPTARDRERYAASLCGGC